MSSGIKDEWMAVADVYAHSLLAAAAERDQDEEVAEQFADLVAYMDRDPSFATFLTSATVDDDVRRVSLEKLFRGKLNDLLLNTLLVLNNRGRGQLVRAVQRAVQLRMEAKHHQQEVVVETAMPLTDDLREAIKKNVSERIGKEALIFEQLRPDLIGGMVIHIGDVQIDGSVLARIQAMRKRLRNRATAEIHKGGQLAAEA